MARKKIREYHGKKLLTKHIPNLTKLEAKQQPQIDCVLVDEKTDFKKLKSEEGEWLGEGKLVVKPDMMFGQRGKHDLVGLNLNFDEAQAFLEKRIGKEVTVNSQTASLTHFIIEPFVPHEREYYVSITIEREFTKFLFSPFGGVGVEENWEKMQEINVEIGDNIDNVNLEKFENAMKIEKISDDEIVTVIEFLKTLYRFYEYLDFTTLEINPFVVNKQGQPTPLDLVAEVDSTAFFKNQAKWGTLPFPLPFGRTMTDEEEFIQKLDEKTGASLKLTILNPAGRIWNMVAGGGASVIFADTVCDVGYSHELANYGEYSGGPSEEETYLYAKTLISLATRNPVPGQKRALLIGGGIANFTDVAITFKGIIHALLEAKDSLKECEMNIWVRRGGVNAQAGLEHMRQLGLQLGIPVIVYGPETHMTFIVREAVDSIFEKEKE